MKSRCMLVLFLFVLFPLRGNAQLKGEKKILIIDPGHGGVDSGAIGVNGILEKDVVLAIAKEVASLNRELLNDKFEIYLSRYSDTLVSLSDRTKLAKVIKPYAYISLHCNHAENNKAKGIEVFVHTSNNGNTIIEKTEIKIASMFLKNIDQKLGFKTRGLKKANFQVLRDARGYYPALLFELGFLSSKDECIYISTKEHYEAVALTILMTLLQQMSYY